MGTTIIKEIEIELEYDDVVNAVNDLSTSEKRELMDDCSLADDIRNDIADDLSDFINENCNGISLSESVAAIHAIIDSSDATVNDVLGRVLSDTDEDIVASICGDSCGKADTGVTEVQKEFLLIVSKYMDENRMSKVVENQKEGAELLKGFLDFLEK